jgi:integrase
LYCAIFLTLVLTGRRRAEVIGMKAGNLILDRDRAYYTYRGKGGKQGHRELPQPALNAIRASLAAFGKDLLPAHELLDALCTAGR